MQLFFSRARPDRPRVESLLTRLRQAGIDVWLTIAAWVVFIISDIAVNAGHSTTGGSAMTIPSAV